MKLKGFIIPTLIIGLAVGILSTPNIIAQETPPVQEQPREIIPQQVKALMLQGMSTQTPRTDIPFDIIKLLYLQTSVPQNLHSIFFFQCKNADLGFKDIAGQAAAVEEKKEATSFQTTPTQLVSLNNLFFHFKQLDGSFEKDIYVPFNQKAAGASYDAEAVEFYSVGYPLPAGNYMLALAITSQDLQTIGIQYFEFTLPNPTSVINGLDITPIFFSKRMEQMAAVEQTVTVHKGIFVYGAYQIEPNLDHVFNPGEALDIFYFIFGAQPQTDDPTKVDIDIDYSILKGEETLIRWATQSTERPVVSLPLPMKQTVIVKTTDEEGNTTEKTEERDLEPGTYTFSIQITDKLSEVSTIKTVQIEVK
jgi:hypothetical protein